MRRCDYNNAAEVYGVAVAFDDAVAALAMDDGFVGGGYGINDNAELTDLLAIARSDGLILDATYTLKAFRGLLARVRGGAIETGARVLFIHTGGHPGTWTRGVYYTCNHTHFCPSFTYIVLRCV
jgi:1-aminocyclopropane-1-carboxylate deaminase/D-cysteine desulfhydrase-like pyridoxal-dependent ACC family enzyme